MEEGQDTSPFLIVKCTAHVLLYPSSLIKHQPIYLSADLIPSHVFEGFSYIYSLFPLFCNINISLSTASFPTVYILWHCPLDERNPQDLTFPSSCYPVSPHL